MRYFLTLRRGALPLLILCLLPLAACSTTEGAANTTADAAETAAEETAEFAGDVAGAVTDAAGTAWNSATDLFDDDPDAEAAALVRPTTAGSVQGTVKFYETDAGLRVAVSLRDLDASRPHGFHIHQTPECSAADTDGDGQMEAAAAAGGHWDPMNTGNHGAATETIEDKHLGDLGNVEAGPDGTVETTFTVANFPVDDYDVAGHAMMVHGGIDDLESDPSGAAGQRVGCGVIERR